MLMLLQLGLKYPEDFIALSSVVGERCDPQCTHVSRSAPSSVSRLCCSRLR